MEELVEQTYLTITAKNDPKDRIQVEIGDSKQPDFKPQVKLMRWDNEVNFSIRAEEDNTAILEVEGEKIKYKAKDYEVHMYDKPDASEEGGFEFEWVLKKKPKSNVLTATIQTKDLQFLYQGELTKKDIEDGCRRPENVIGSYAVYHASKGLLNNSNGKDYKVGKAFHIYRPKATDANGKWTWCDLHVDEDNGLLTVTIPQKFLDDAEYSVVVDPTFGYTTGGGSTTSVTDESSTTRVGYVAQPVANGVLNYVSVALATNDDSSVNAKVFVNEKDSGGVGTHAQIATVTRNGLPPSGWVRFVANGESLTGGVDYILSFLGDDSTVSLGDDIFMFYDSDGTYYTESATYASPESPWVVSSSSGRKYSIYGTYSTTRFYLPSSGAAPISPNYSAKWDGEADDFARGPAEVSKQNSVMTTRSLDGNGDTSDTDYIYGQWVSKPIVAQTISAQTITLQVRASEENARCNQVVSISIRIVSNDGSVVRGTINESRDDLELSVGTLLSREHTFTSTQVVAQDDDRIVIEIGTGGNPSTGSGGNSHDADMSYGDDSATDIKRGTNQIAAYNPWVEFDSIIEFVSVASDILKISGVAQASIQDVSAVAAADISKVAGVSF